MATGRLFEKPSLITRIVVGKAVGLVIGLIGLITLPWLLPDADWLFRILLWYTTLGAIVGVFGVFTWHPVLKLPTPWWFRAPLIGAWMNFVLTFFSYDAMRPVPVSPWLFVVQGAVVGLIIGYLATRLGGEGKESVPA